MMNRRKLFSFLAAAPVVGIGAVIAAKNVEPEVVGPFLGQIRHRFRYEPIYYTGGSHTHTVSAIPSHAHSISTGETGYVVNYQEQWHGNGKGWVRIS
jgi:hypothetical protein